MSYELIITEKPSAAQKIAQALANGKPIKKNDKGVPYYEITHGGKDIVVGCAVGHLYTVAEKDGKGWVYPVFDVEWRATSQVRKDAKFTAKYLTLLKKLAKDADTFTVATDFDIEGEVIGLNVVRYAAKRKDARRMKFSTLTKDELVRAYEHAQPTLDWGQARAGETRHILDYFYGINLSRALSLAVKSAGMFKVLSSGRVQGPALKIIVDKEKEIRAFVPEPFWQVELTTQELSALHKKDKFFDKAEASSAFNKVKDQTQTTVFDVSAKRFEQKPPHPFDLTTLQTETYRSMGIQPKDTLAIAQELYTHGLISYPRTSSQQLPPEIGFTKILQDLQKQEKYAKLAKTTLARKNLIPNNGKKTDPAHPAIYPTGQREKLDGREAKVYDIIVRRFLATFAEPAMRETVQIDLDCSGEPFMTKGTRTIEKGWHEFYGPHVKLEEEEMPPVQKGDILDVMKTQMHDKETQPPKRYTPASIIKELEKRGLGTKATRAAIVDSLYQRGYVHEKSIQATEIGIRTCETLERYAPSILDEKLTRHFEDEMEEIRQGKKKEEDILARARQVLEKLLSEFKAKEKQVGADLIKAMKETRDEINFVGCCPKCKEGDLQIRKGRYGRFIACNKYPECKTTFSLPSSGVVKGLRKDCTECAYPLIEIHARRKRPQQLCINPDCPAKTASKEDAKKYEKPCPKCKGRLVVRTSIYGAFLGCSSYPKCRHNEPLPQAEEKAAAVGGVKE